MTLEKELRAALPAKPGPETPAEWLHEELTSVHGVLKSGHAAAGTFQRDTITDFAPAARKAQASKRSSSFAHYTPYFDMQTLSISFRGMSL